MVKSNKNSKVHAKGRAGKTQMLNLNLKSQILLILVFSFLAQPAWAKTLSSDNYQVQMGDVNISSTKESTPTSKPGDIFFQTPIKNINPFSFTISDLAIDFGSFVPETANTQTNTLTVSSGGAGYSVVAFEDHPLKSLENPLITMPDTTCNGGPQTCDETQAKLWNDNSAYGFGFNMAGDDVVSDFVAQTYYRQFANSETKETAQEIMSSNGADKDKNATVTYKVNISLQQPEGQYENTITFVAMPGY